MERKIGEIFEYNGEWYQCLEEKTCTCFGCDFRDYNCDDISLQRVKGSCQSERRKDNKSIIFKKLEKVGEPYVAYGKVRQKYKLHAPLTITNGIIDKDISCDDVNGIVDIEIKQNKEDMEEIEWKTEKIEQYSRGKRPKISGQEELNLKPFDLEAAKQGKPVCTRDGRKARIICFDAKDTQPIIGLYEKNIDGIVREYLCSYHTDGRMYDDQDTGYDLMMLPEKRSGWVNIVKEAISDDRVALGRIFDSYEDAFRSGKANERYIETVKIEWTE